jgi:hypothetical protein
MEALIELLARSGANVGLAAYSILVTTALVIVNQERRKNAEQIIQQMKDSNDALAPIERIVEKCQTMLEILTRGRK